MLVKITIDELAHHEHLPFDLFSSSGERLYAAGHPLADKGQQLLQKGIIYRSSTHLPMAINPELAADDSEAPHWFDHEGKKFHIVQPELTEEERHELTLENSKEIIYGPELAQSFINSIHYFWDRMARGATPDIALCEVLSEKMIAQVTSKADQIHYLSQVRVRDQFTYAHILDVTALSVALAIKIGLSKKEIKEVALAGILHDMGKLLIPKSIMFKSSRLTEKEFQVMKLHPELGYKILKNEMKLPDEICRPALEHQEMYSGGGYPQNISGDQIHPYSHIVKIADVYDALTSKRPYKESIPSFKAIKIMLSEGEKSFHPEYLKHFVELSNFYDPSQSLAHERAS